MDKGSKPEEIKKAAVSAFKEAMGMRGAYNLSLSSKKEEKRGVWRGVKRVHNEPGHYTQPHPRLMWEKENRNGALQDESFSAHTLIKEERFMSSSGSGLQDAPYN